MRDLPRLSPIAAIVVVLIASLPASAQLDTGSIVGTVRDQSSAVVPGATVTAVKLYF